MSSSHEEVTPLLTESEGEDSGDSGQSSEAEKETEDLWQAPKPCKAPAAARQTENATTLQHDQHDRRQRESGRERVAMPANGNCQFESMTDWMEGGKGFENQAAA
eukprot:1231832-Rhodomonas_salina.1